jgi:hypothetical protein
MAADNGDYSALITAIESCFLTVETAHLLQWEIIGASGTSYQCTTVLCCLEN